MKQHTVRDIVYRAYTGHSVLHTRGWPLPFAHRTCTYVHTYVGRWWPRACLPTHPGNSGKFLADGRDRWMSIVYSSGSSDDEIAAAEFLWKLYGRVQFGVLFNFIEVSFVFSKKKKS